MAMTSFGPAAPGWPASGGAIAGGRLHMVSRNLDGTHVAEVDAATLTVRHQRRIPQGDGAWGVHATPQEVTLGLFGAARGENLLRLTRAGVDVLAALHVLYVWDLDRTSHGHVVGVGGQPSLVFGYDQVTRRAKDLGVISGGQAVRTCAVVGSTLVVGGSTGAGGALLLAADLRPDLGVAQVRAILPPACAGDEAVYCSAATLDGRVAVGTTGARRGDPAVAVVDPRTGGAVVVRLPGESTVDTITAVGQDLLCTARPSGGLYRIHPPTARVSLVTVPVAQSETRAVAVAGDTAIGVSADGSVWRSDVRSRRTMRRTPVEMGLTPRPQRAQSICAGRGRVDVGGSFTVTRHAVGNARNRTRFVPGEPKCMVEVAGTTYMAIYPVGEVWAWTAWADAPARLASLDPGQFRPIAIAHVRAIDALAVTATDDRARSVLHLVDRRTGRVEALANPLGAQAVSGLAVDGGTLYVGGSGTAPSVAAVDAATGRTRWQVDGVVPDGSFVLGLQVVGGLLAVSTVRGWVTTIDLATRRVAPPVRVAPNAGQLRRWADRLVLATGDGVLSVDPRRRTAVPLATGLGGQYWNWAPLDVGADGRVWTLRRRELVRLDLGRSD